MATEHPLQPNVASREPSADREARLALCKQRFIEKLVMLFRRKLESSWHRYLTPTRAARREPSERMRRLIDMLCAMYRERLERSVGNGQGQRTA